LRYPEFSEFSFGFALTENLINGSYLPGVKGAPTFPNLYSEGKAGGGYDVKIPAKGFPLFLQFKIPQVITRATSKQPAGFSRPYYRMHLLRRKHSLQHQSLLSHANRGRLVYYVTPTFHTTTDLNRHYDKRAVPQNSIFIRPNQIGPLDDSGHHVAYMKNSNVAWLCSEPTQLEGGINCEHFLLDLKKSVGLNYAKAITSAFFEMLADEIIETRRDLILESGFHGKQRPFKKHGENGSLWDELAPDIPPNLLARVMAQAERVEDRTREHFHTLRDRYPLPAAVGYMARLYLDCELIIMGGS
jgi:hypothetical protein